MQHTDIATHATGAGAPPAHRPRLVIWLRLMLLVAALAAAGWSAWLATRPLEATVIIPLPAIERQGEPVRHRNGGTVREIHVRLGQNVKAGDVVLVLDDVAVTAPRDGLIVALHAAAPGDRIAPGATVFAIAPRAVITLQA